MPVYLPKWKFLGDTDSARDEMGAGYRRLLALHHDMDFRGIKIYSNQLHLADGTVIICESIHGADTITVYVPPLLEAKPKKKKVVETIVTEDYRELILIAVGYYNEQAVPSGTYEASYVEERFMDRYYSVWDPAKQSVVMGPGDVDDLNEFGIFLVERFVLEDGSYDRRMDIDWDRTMVGAKGATVKAPDSGRLYCLHANSGDLLTSWIAFIYVASFIAEPHACSVAIPIDTTPPECVTPDSCRCGDCGGDLPKSIYHRWENTLVCNARAIGGGPLLDIGYRLKSYDFRYLVGKCMIVNPLNPPCYTSYVGCPDCGGSGGGCWACGEIRTHRWGQIYNFNQRVVGTWHIYCKNPGGDDDYCFTTKEYLGEIYIEYDHVQVTWGGCTECAYIWREFRPFTADYIYTSHTHLGQLPPLIDRNYYYGLKEAVGDPLLYYGDPQCVAAQYSSNFKGEWSEHVLPDEKGIFVQYVMAQTARTLVPFKNGLTSAGWDFTQPYDEDRVLTVYAAYDRVDDPKHSSPFTNPSRNSSLERAIEDLIEYYYAENGVSDTAIPGSTDIEMRICIAKELTSKTREFEVDEFGNEV